MISISLLDPFNLFSLIRLILLLFLVGFPLQFHLLTLLLHFVDHIVVEFLFVVLAVRRFVNTNQAL